MLLDQHGRPLVRTAPESITIAQLNKIIRAERGGTATPEKCVGWYYSALVQIANAVAQMPLQLWRLDPTRRGARPGYRQILEHRIMARLTRPTPTYSMIRWLGQWASILLDQGDVFCIPDEMPGPDGLAPRALPLYGRMQVQPIREGYGGPLIAWRVRRSPMTKPDVVEIDKVMHWALPNPHDDIMGCAPKDAIRFDLDAEFARTIYEKSFYNRAAMPAGVLINKHQELDGNQRNEVREAFEEFHGGPTNAGRLLILGNDWDFRQWAFQQSQAQFIESGKLNREKIAAVMLGFPVGLLNAQENGGLSRAGEEADRLKLYENCAFPLARMFEPEFNYGFVQRAAPRHEAAFDTRQVPVALAYAKVEAEILAMYVKSGIAVNPVIDALDLPFDPQPGGDVPLVSNTLAPLELVGDTEHEHAAIDVTPGDEEPAALQAPATEAAARPAVTRAQDPLNPIIGKLRRKVKRILYDIRRVAVRDPDRACRGATVGERRQWARLVLPPVAVALEVGADPATLASVDAAEVGRSLIALQERADDIRFVNEARAAACELAVRTLLAFLDETLRDAGANADPGKYLASLDRAAALIAEPTIRDAVAAGAATLEAA